MKLYPIYGKNFVVCGNDLLVNIVYYSLRGSKYSYQYPSDSHLHITAILWDLMTSSSLL